MRRVLLILVILVIEFALIEAGLRAYGGSEASPAFQSLFMQDSAVGYRLKPNAHARYTTAEFSTDLAINAQGVRDDQPIGPKASNERRIVVLGDSLVLSVQVDLQQTFCRLLQDDLNRAHPDVHWRVINGGVQGYDPVDEWLLFSHVAEDFQPDIVLVSTMVGKAADAGGKARLLDGEPPPQASGIAALGVRRLLRSSMALQIVQLRYTQLKARFTSAAPEVPLAPFLANPPASVQEGLDVARRAIGMIAERAAERGASTGVILMPARFQTDDADYGRLAEIVRQAGGTLVRNGATDRSLAAFAPLGLPMFNPVPALSVQPDRAGLFFQQNVHLTPRGHRVVADALLQFLETSGLLARAERGPATAAGTAPRTLLR